MVEPVTFINRCTWTSWFLLNTVILKGARHPKLWGNKFTTAALKELQAAWKELKTSDQVFRLATVNSNLIKLRLQSGAFSVDETMALSAFAHQTISEFSK
jgi:hypothetical protein